jgi:hypothetical protein
MRYDQDSSGHAWYTAPSGTAGNAISFTQAMTLDASGNLGVGETNPTLKLHVVSASGSVAYFQTSDTASGPFVVWRNGTTSIGDVGSGKGISGSGNATDFMIASRSTYPLIFGTNSAERARITSGGVLDIGTGAGAVGQIQFPATQVASSNANTLDDYEEGTWTATLTDGTNTTTSDGATFRKIGSLVFVSFQFYNKNISAWNAANLSVTGLPFTVATNHDSFVTANTPNGFTVSGPLAMGFSNGSTSSSLYYRGGSSNWAGVQKGDITNNSNFSLYLSACYTAS